MRLLMAKELRRTDVIPGTSKKYLELPIVNASGKITLTHHPCNPALEGRYTIPGLDASLCQCEACTGRASGGIWWVDEAMRLKIRHSKRKRIGDLSLDAAQENGNGRR